MHEVFEFFLALVAIGIGIVFPLSWFVCNKPLP